ncbi:saccharopine dehydrogenase NADP-binding domain-containing protein [Lentzea sp. DG1S-22]|uniref:saccharopine dehydrogenase family protein n=1 Tax=Lentzea sp. DG1S-22 TaxID=3108822 RepID=UPI002E786AE7|nr:saccharopine dehydrogenase NADP-binding domain-containing protein [Lentzea sp. DG1S-22]WVH77318.1 saccharopine dehydrogenase NADP-binding domain-containing protein [Lentzea sp. DG1S-22]
MTWMVYGANGYTGRLIAELAVERGERPILAGRSREKVEPLAAALGLEHRAFGLAEAGRNLEDVDAVVHCAGPFSQTSEAMVDACLRSRTHYLDITGEIDVFESVSLRDVDARKAGIVLLPGAGFDVVPTDCVAAILKNALPSATHLDLAFVVGGGASAGTTKTSVEAAAVGGRIRVNGELRSVRIGHRRRTARFRSGPREVGSIPWGDVSTAYRSTGIPNITTFTLVPGVLGQLQQVFAPVLQTSFVQSFAKTVAGKVKGPDERKRAKTRAEVFGEAWDARTKVECAVTTPNAYSLTADAVLRAVTRIGDVAPGSHTPSSAFGAGFVRELDGVVVGEVRFT